jgi:hypothetical protein
MNLFRQWTRPVADAARASASGTDEEFAKSIAKTVVQNGLAVPAVMFLEACRPLSFVMGQGVHFLSPILGGFVPMDKSARLAAMLDSPDGYERLIAAIEDLSQPADGNSDGSGNAGVAK